MSQCHCQLVNCRWRGTFHFVPRCAPSRGNCILMRHKRVFTCTTVRCCDRHREFCAQKDGHQPPSSKVRAVFIHAKQQVDHVYEPTCGVSPRPLSSASVRSGSTSPHATNANSHIPSHMHALRRPAPPNFFNFRKKNEKSLFPRKKGSEHCFCQYCRAPVVKDPFKNRPRTCIFEVFCTRRKMEGPH